MTNDERELLLLLADEIAAPGDAIRSADRIAPILARVRKLHSQPRKLIPGEIITVRFVVTRVDGGFVYLKSSDGWQTYRRLSDIVREGEQKCT